MSKEWIRFWSLACILLYVAGVLKSFGRELAVFEATMAMTPKTLHGDVRYAAAGLLMRGVCFYPRPKMRVQFNTQDEVSDREVCLMNDGSAHDNLLSPIWSTFTSLAVKNGCEPKNRIFVH
jgi:hypothetical protein